MRKPRPKPTAPKHKNDIVRVVAVRHPPTHSTSQTKVYAQSPYVTDHGFLQFLENQATRLPPGGDTPCAQPEALRAIGENILEGFGTHEKHLTGADRPALLAALLSATQQRLFQGAYQGIGNPIYPLEAFVAFHHLGLYPPLWVLNWLDEVFNSYLKLGGKKSLEALLGAKRGKGQTPVFKEAAAIGGETAMMREIAGLTILGIGIEDAALMVERRWRQCKVKCPSADTLAERFVKRGWSKMFKPLKTAFAIPSELRKTLLEAYPAEMRYRPSFECDQPVGNS